MRARGIDISKYDQGFDPTKATEPIDFVVQRSSYGYTPDELFNVLQPGVQQIPVRLAYHYLSSGLDLNKQVDTFLSNTSGKGFHAYVCDFEGYYNTMSTAFAKMAWDFCKKVAVSTGKRCLIYTNFYNYKDYLVPSQKEYGIDWNIVDLWYANYPNVPNPEGLPPVIPGRITGWSMWQYSAKGNGAAYGLTRTTAADLDVFNGDVTALREYFKVTDPSPTPPPTPNPTAEITLELNGKTYSGSTELKPQ